MPENRFHRAAAPCGEADDMAIAGLTRSTSAVV